MRTFLFNNKIHTTSFHVITGLLVNYVECTSSSSPPSPSFRNQTTINNSNETNIELTKLTNHVVILALILSSIVLLTVFGNILVLLAIFFDFHLRSPTHYLMGSLAFADFLIGNLFLLIRKLFEINEV